jgi:hypothetical protein
MRLGAYAQPRQHKSKADVRINPGLARINALARGLLDEIAAPDIAAALALEATVQQV